jgi:hypothetical protein
MAGLKSPGGEAEASEEGGWVAGIVLTGGSDGLLGDRRLARAPLVREARSRSPRLSGVPTPAGGCPPAAKSVGLLLPAFRPAGALA